MTTITEIAPADRPTWELYSACVHCGLCLPFCPTYRVLGQEADSPRGRIYQALLVDEGRLAVGDTYVTHIDRCLGCRACESACPSGVQYGRIVEQARAQIEHDYRRPWLARRLRRWFYRSVLPDLDALQRLARLLRFYQRSGLEKLLRAGGLLKLLGLEEVAALAPRIDDQFFFEEFGMVFPAVGECRGRVALLGGCIAGVAFTALNRATLRVLAENGLEVHVPAGQGCCGALHAHGGYLEEARELARQNLRAFEDDRYDAILSNAAGCGATMKEYADLLAHDPEYAERARAFVAKVKDVTEYLAEIGLRPVAHPVGKRVTYQDPCHLAHGQRVRSAPRALLKAAGAELVEMAHPDYCCGSAGTYNLVERELASRILEARMDEVAATGAPILATANVGCMLQLRAGVARRALRMEVKHVIEVLNEAY